MAWADTWIEQADTNGSWLSVACSSDGQIVYAGAQDDLYRSTDAGVTWSGLGLDDYFASVACSDDGAIFVAAGYDRLYVSTNGGSSTSIYGIGTYWGRVCCSTDGVKMAASVNRSDGNIYVSDDTGANWATTQTAQNWYHIDCSAEGNTLLASTSTDLYKSTNFGTSWASIYTGAQIDKFACSADASVIYGYRTSDSKTIISTDGGANWVETTIPTTGADRGIACTPDGSKAIGGNSGGGSRIYVTEDSGATWTAQGPTSDSLYGFALSDDGSLAFVVARFSSVYVSTNTIAVPVTATLTGGFTYVEPEPEPPIPPFDAASTYWVDRFFPGQPGASQLLFLHVFAQSVTFSDGMPSSQAASITDPDAETVYSIQLDGVEVGTITYAIGSNVGVFAAPAEFTALPGQLLSIVAPSSPDASHADLTFTLVGNTAPGTGNPRPVNLTGEIALSVSVTGRLTSVPELTGSISTGKTSVNGRLSVTHDLAIFNV